MFNGSPEKLETDTDSVYCETLKDYYVERRDPVSDAESKNESEDISSETSSHDVQGGDIHGKDSENHQEHYTNGEILMDHDEDVEGEELDDDHLSTEKNQEICDGDKQSVEPTDLDPLMEARDITVKREHIFSSDGLNPDQWTLPADKGICTLEEIRRGQVINKTGANECPVPGCGKKINEARIDPSPGTIASGLRTHVLFVHYANRKVVKKRKLGWSTKRKNPPSPRKPIGSLLNHSSPSTSGYELENSSVANLNSSLNLIHKGLAPSRSQTLPPGSILNKKVKQISAAKSQMPQKVSSLQSLVQMTTTGPKMSGQKSKLQDTQNLNPTTSSLFSILAGLTQQQNSNPAHTQISKSNKAAQGINTINISPCPRNLTNNDRPVNSSLLSLLNEKISGNVASSLQNQLKKSLGTESRTKSSTVTSQQGVTSPISTPYYHANHHDSGLINSSSILSSLCTGNADTRLSHSYPINSFIESIASRTGSNIGPGGIAEARRIIEKFTTSLICSSQTIADHYIAPFAGEIPQQKPEISPSDLVLAYKMMHKSHGQP